LLGTVDALVIGRDFHSISKITDQLATVANEKALRIGGLKKEQEILGDVDYHARTFVEELFQHMNSALTADSEAYTTKTFGDIDVIEERGMTAWEEEKEFGQTNKKMNHYESLGYHSCTRTFDERDDKLESQYHAGSQNFDQTSARHRKDWGRACDKTLKEISKGSPCSPIAYLSKSLVGGALYDRAFAVWASTAYGLLLPTADDLKCIANIVGSDSEMPGDTFEIKKAKRQAELYIGRLLPAVQYLCQKMEFLLMKVFDTAWLSVESQENNAKIADVLGRDSFKSVVKGILCHEISKSGTLAYHRVFGDLRNEVYKLTPYEKNSPSVTGMKFAFPKQIGDIDLTMKGYSDKVSSVVKSYNEEKCPNPYGALKKGILFGLNLLADAGSVTPLITVGLSILKEAVTSICTALEDQHNSASGPLPLSEDADQHALGVAVALYSHFLPRFIASIDGRVRSDLWTIKNAARKEATKERVMKSTIVMSRKKTKGDNAKQIEDLVAQKMDIDKSREELQEFLAIRNFSPSLQRFLSDMSGMASSEEAWISTTMTATSLTGEPQHLRSGYYQRACREATVNERKRFDT
jgi:hypothetical protein